MREIRLYGHLREFGNSFMLNVRSPREAVHALCCMIPGFRKRLLQDDQSLYQVLVDDRAVLMHHLELPIGGKEIIKIVPVITGAGGSKAMSFIGIVVGIILIVFSGPIGGAIGGAFNAGTAATAAITSAVSSLGWSLAITGVSQLLFAPPKAKTADSKESPENMPSYAFNGPVNTLQQGNPVPVLYGKLRVGSQVISGGLFAEAMYV